MASNTQVSNKLDELREEYYLDVQGSGTVENVAELIAKVSAGAIVLWFSFNELIDELNQYKKLRRDQRKESNGSSSEL